MTIDLEQFYEVFFEESLEGLDVMEQALLGASSNGVDDESINTIFRAAHSIKGGSGTFGFNEITDFTHVMETLLDEVRDAKRDLTEETIELLLKSCDCLRGMIESLQLKKELDSTESTPLIAAFEAILNGKSDKLIDSNNKIQNDTNSSLDTSDAEQTADAVDSDSILKDSFDLLLTDTVTKPSVAVDDVNAGTPSSKGWRIRFIPEPQILLTGNEPIRLFRELAELGEFTSVAHTENLPGFDSLTVDECLLSWTLQLLTDASKEDVLEIFDWVMDECSLEVTPLGDVPDTGIDKSEAERPALDSIDLEQEPAELVNIESASAVRAVDEEEKAAVVTQSIKKTEPEAGSASATSTGSIRVGIDKVDSLINLVGELVITQSMLSELGNNFEVEKLDRLSMGLEQLLQNTKELQESVMRIRMLPISFAFNRFPRMIRDLANKTGKKVELILNGENTEIDKTVMEQIGDPLVHLVRNAIDHGIEPVEERLANGKLEQGTISLNAYHQGGNVVVEIKDDGRGIDASVILAKAKEKGLVDGAAELSESRIFDLIFEPGFSTAAVVSDISGRGVGMDVVRRNINSLGGRIEIESKLGKGSTFKVFLPLTLAILDGQLVRVGSEIYIVPLISIVESLQIKPELVNQVGGNMALYRLREDNVPIIPIYKEFGIEAENTQLEDGLLVVVEGEGQKIGLLVDDLLAQQQVVIKSLVNNYRKVEGVSGATILGDGSVSLILDVGGLIRHASERSSKLRRSKKHIKAA